MLWERVRLSKVWNLQSATLLLTHSFIKDKLLCRCCSSLLHKYFLEARILWNISWCLFPLYVNCEILFKFFLSYFSETNILRSIIWWLLPLSVNCEILLNVKMSRKPLDNRSSGPKVFHKKGVLKNKNFEKFTWKHLCQSL